jgi:ATP-binding cassette subfamily B protein
MTDPATIPSGGTTTLRRVASLFHARRRALVAVIVPTVVFGVIGVATPFLLRQMVDGAIPDGDTKQVTVLALLMLAVAAIGTACMVTAAYFASVLGNGITHDLRVATYDRLQRMSLRFFTATRAGEVQSRLISDTAAAEGSVRILTTRVLADAVEVCAAVVALAILDWRLLGFALLFAPPAAIISRRVGDKRAAAAHELQEASADVSALVGETLSVSGILLGRSLGRSAQLAARFRTGSRELARLAVRREMAGRWGEGSLALATASLAPLAYWAGGIAIARGDGGITLGALIAFVALQRQLFFPLRDLLSARADVRVAALLFRRIFTYLDHPLDIDERDDPVVLARPQVRGEIVFDNVSLDYTPEGIPTLQGLSFRIVAGSRVGIVGATGSGKTSIGYLARRLYDPTAGSVRLDGIDLRDLSLESVADAVCLVSQETYLLHDTIRANLQLAAPGAGEAEIAAACRLARIHDLVAALPDGYDTVVGERGYRFSGGEKQRFAIARAILRDAPVLVLDEATSALDVETEVHIAAALDRYAADRTVVTIAHRLSTVRDADVIIVIDRGCLVEQGSHAELLALGGRYAAMVARDTSSPRVRHHALPISA